jgi:3D (Asp-Asp-Asp) domain-containing protein
VTAKKIVTSTGEYRRATAGEAIRMRAAGVIPDPRRFARAQAGEEVPITITQYCLKGTTRRGRFVRPGIVAADPRIFPLARYVEVFMGRKYLGRFLVDDTGGNVIGATLDIWTPSCRQASRFGRHTGKAVLVAKEEEHLLPPVLSEIDVIPNLTAIGELFEGIAKR